MEKRGNKLAWTTSAAKIVTLNHQAILETKIREVAVEIRWEEVIKSNRIPDTH